VYISFEEKIVIKFLSSSLLPRKKWFCWSI